MKQYTCDVAVSGQGVAKGVVVWLKSPSHSEAKQVGQTQFPGKTIVSVSNLKEKK